MRDQNRNTHHRRPRGSPVGGQFAGKANPEPDVELQAGVTTTCLSGPLQVSYDKSRLAGRSHEDALADAEFEANMDPMDIPYGSSHDKVMDVRRIGGDFGWYKFAVEMGLTHDESIGCSVNTDLGRPAPSER